MKVAIVNTWDNAGGAARAAFRLMQGLSEAGSLPLMLVQEKFSSVSRVHQIRSVGYEFEREVALTIQDKFILKNRTPLSNTFYSYPYPGVMLADLPQVQQADVINLHWLAGFQSVESIAGLLALGKPVVWTLHDQFPFTGGCHYTAGCDGYRKNCRDCPQILDNSQQLSKLVLDLKARLLAVDNLTIVTPSRWLAKCSKESRVLGHCRTEVIPNSLESEIFKPTSKAEAKKSLGLDPATLTLMFGAESHGERRKGFSELIEIMKISLTDSNFAKFCQESKLVVLTTGTPDPEITALGLPTRELGYIHDNHKLARVYSAADIYLLPSLEDNLPNTMLESMACATPVIAFNVGGMPDMIVDGSTGYTVTLGDCAAFSRALNALLFDQGKLLSMGGNCRKLIEAEFTLKKQGENYKKLFTELMPETISSPLESDCFSQPDGSPIDPQPVLPDMDSSFFNVYRLVANEIYSYQKSLSNRSKVETCLDRTEEIMRKVYRKMIRK